MKKIYYKIIFEAETALAVGSGSNDNSDNDIVKNNRGEAFIPGSSLAGIYRSFFEKEEADKYFGRIDKKNQDNSTESLVVVYDASIMENEYHKVSKRDCVAIDDKTKVAKKGAKFDFEILEPHVKFVTYIEQNINDGNDENIIDIILGKWKGNQILIGGKTARGCGKTKLLEVYKKEYNLPEDRETWLKFDMYNWENDESILDEIKQESDDEISFNIKLKQAGGISIRKYTTAINKVDDAKPDYEQYGYYNKNKEFVPVISGTSWAGSFRHHISSMNSEILMEDIFGKLEKKSSIFFSDSEIEEAHEKLVTRNAINRFTGGGVKGALYTEKFYYGGYTSLTISIKRDAMTVEFSKALSCTIADLHSGILSLGGLTSVGRGLFVIEKIELNNDKIWEKDDKQRYEQANDIYEILNKKLEVC